MNKIMAVKKLCSIISYSHKFISEQSIELQRRNCFIILRILYALTICLFHFNDLSLFKSHKNCNRKYIHTYIVANVLKPLLLVQSFSINQHLYNSIKQKKTRQQSIWVNIKLWCYFCVRSNETKCVLFVFVHSTVHQTSFLSCYLEEVVWKLNQIIELTFTQYKKLTLLVLKVHHTWNSGFIRLTSMCNLYLM